LLAIVEIIRGGLVRDQHVRLHNFGTFRLRWNKERRVKHPQTGETISVAPAPKVTFTPAKQLRELVDPDREPAIPINNLVSEKNHGLTDQGNIRQIQPGFPNENNKTNEEQNLYHLSNLKESVQNIIDEKYKPPEINITNLNSTQDAKSGVDEKSGKKWALGFLAAVPLILILLQADFSTDKSNVADKVNISKANSVVSLSEKGTTLSSTDIDREQDTTAANQAGTNSSRGIHPESLTTAPTEQATINFYLSPQLHTIQAGENLWTLAERFYGDALLWPHIFRANIRTMTDPDRIIAGRQLVIPGLQQAPGSLSRKDKELIAEGYFEVYQVHKTKEHQKAIYFLIAAKHYSLEWLIKMKPVIPRNDWKMIARN